MSEPINEPKTSDPNAVLKEVSIRLTNIEAILEEIREMQAETQESIANLSLPGGRYGIEYGD